MKICMIVTHGISPWLRLSKPFHLVSCLIFIGYPRHFAVATFKRIERQIAPYSNCRYPRHFAVATFKLIMVVIIALCGGGYPRHFAVATFKPIAGC